MPPRTRSGHFLRVAAQSRSDRDLFDRKVGIVLYFDKDHRFTTLQVNVFYTFL